MTIFSGQSVISRVYTSRFGNGTSSHGTSTEVVLKKYQVPGTVPSGKPPKSEPYRTVPCRTMQWKSAIWKCSIWLPLSKYRSLFTNDLLFAADTGLYFILIRLVLSSAFDTVDHNVLINYLKTCVGISDVALDWFISLFIEQVLVSSAWRCRLLSCFSILWGPSRIYFGSPFVSYLQTRFPKSWDTVQIVNKNRMQWCGRFKFQYFIRNTT